MTQQRYRTLLADPPWNIGQVGGGGCGAARHYPVMSVEQVAALPVQGLAADNAHRWLWVTNASLFAGQSVMEAWGNEVHSDVAL